MKLTITACLLGFVLYSLPATAGEENPAAIDRFAQVDEGVYRGALPSKHPEQMQTLKAYGIKTIINLSDDEKNAVVEAELAKQAGIKFINYPMHGWNTPKDEQTAYVQSVLNDPNLRPVYVHCRHGRERTGVMVALYRVFSNGWTAHAAYREMKDMGFRTFAWNFRKYFKRKSGYYEEEEANENKLVAESQMAAGY